MQKRGIRANNPFNLVDVGIKWDGLATPPNDGGPGVAEPFLSRFLHPWEGIRAGVTDIGGDIAIDGLNTVEKLISTYAPASDKRNNTKEYIDFVAKRLHVLPTEKIDFKKHFVPLLLAVVKMEQGIELSTAYNGVEINKGLQAGMIKLASKGIDTTGILTAFA